MHTDWAMADVESRFRTAWDGTIIRRRTATASPLGSTLTAAAGDVAMIWSEQALDELPARAKGRSLLLDYFASRCCGRNVSVGDLYMCWSAPDKPIASEFLALRAPTGIEAYVQRDLVRVLEGAGGRVVMRGWGWFRRPVVELADGAVWLDFIGACRTRSALRH